MEKDVRFNMAKFIETVQEYPMLYNIDHADYKNHTKKSKVWCIIAEQVGLPSGSVAKFKWRNLKDSYVKYRRELVKSNGKRNELRKYKNWPWVNYLEFLKPFFGNQKALKCEPMVTYGEDSQSEEPVHFLDDSSSCKYTENLLTEAPEAIAITPEYLQMNENELLFLSYAKQINDFSKKRQITVKMKIAEIMMQAALEELDEDPFSQSSNVS